MYMLFAILLTGSVGISPSLRGSKASMERQNRQANFEKLTEIRDTEQLRRLVQQGVLAPLRDRAGVIIDDRLDPDLRFARPDSVDWLNYLGSAFVKEFPGESLTVTSAVRTIEYQKRLRRRNDNASKADRSSHIRGSTIDITKLTLSKEQRAWVRAHLLREERLGKIEATEERRQSCFHIMVFREHPYWLPRKASHKKPKAPRSGASFL